MLFSWYLKDLLPRQAEELCQQIDSPSSHPLFCLSCEIIPHLPYFSSKIPSSNCILLTTSHKVMYFLLYCTCFTLNISPSLFTPFLKRTLQSLFAFIIFKRFQPASKLLLTSSCFTSWKIAINRIFLQKAFHSSTSQLNWSRSARYLGIHLDWNVNWSTHIQHITKLVLPWLGMVGKPWAFWAQPPDQRKILPQIIYAAIVWAQVPPSRLYLISPPPSRLCWNVLRWHRHRCDY